MNEGLQVLPMTSIRRLAFTMTIPLLWTSSAWAQESPSFAQQVAAAVAAAPLDVVQATPPQDGSAPPAVAVEYSDAYRTRAKIHKLASFTTLPLFGVEGLVGQKLYNARVNGENTDTLKTTHLAVATGIGGLFAVNTVTGLWNLLESRKDHSHRTIKWVHGLLMLGADAGFLAAAATGPGGDEGERFRVEDPSAHRAIAFTAIGTATTSYLIMLLGAH
jgi:hypothetical protein